MSADTWTPERTAALERLFGKRMNLTAIAAELGGITRSAVSNKVKRLGLDRPSKPAAVKLCRVAPQRALPPAPEPPSDPVFGAAAAVRALKTDRECCWPLGNPFDNTFRFCAAPARHRTSPKGDPRFYCAEHHAMRAGPGTPFERAADRQPRSNRPPDWRSSP